MKEEPVVFDCYAEPLVGIIHEPEKPMTTGVIIIVAGGPQYRVGAHRQFVTLSRLLSSQGVPVLRFDHRGTGDSSGEYRGFIDMDDDIESAIEILFAKFPQLEQVALWGECESASAAAFYAHNDARVSGIFMVNPWIRTQAGQAKTYLKHYYWNRLKDPQFWKKIGSGQFSFIYSLKAYIQLRYHARKKQPDNNSKQDSLAELPLPERLTKSLQLFNGKLFILTSGNDYIAQEFKDFMKISELWRQSGLDKKVTFQEIQDADHTFSRTEWRSELFNQTVKWLTTTTSSSY